MNLCTPFWRQHDKTPWTPDDHDEQQVWRKCRRCGRIWLSDRCAVMGHQWGKWNEVPAQINTEQFRQCRRCGFVVGRPIQAQ